MYTVKKDRIPTGVYSHRVGTFVYKNGYKFVEVTSPNGNEQDAFDAAQEVAKSMNAKVYW